MYKKYGPLAEYSIFFTDLLGYQIFLHPMGPRKLWATPTNGQCCLAKGCLGAGMGPILHPAIVLSDNLLFVTSHPGTHRVQDFLITQGAIARKTPLFASYGIAHMATMN